MPKNTTMARINASTGTKKPSKTVAGFGFWQGFATVLDLGWVGSLDRPKTEIPGFEADGAALYDDFTRAVHHLNQDSVTEGDLTLSAW